MTFPTFEQHSDTGKSWLAVPRDLLTELGIDREISPFSYQADDGTVYLEEMEDMPRFTAAMRAARRIYTIRETPTRQGNNPIRAMQAYTGGK